MINNQTLRFLSNRTIAVCSIVFAAALATLLFSARSASAATCTYASAGTTNFNAAANWDCGFVPGASSTAIIPNSTSTVMSAAVTVSNLQIGTSATSTATLDTNWFALTITNTVTSTGTLVARGSQISVGNDLIFSNGGTFTAATSTLTFNTSTTDASGHLFKSDSDVTLFNFTASSSMNLRMSSNVLVTVGNSFNDRSQATIFFDNGSDMTVTGTSTISVNSIFGRCTGTTSDHVFTFNSTTTNNGQITSFGDAVWVFNGDFVNSGQLTSAEGDVPSITFNKQWTNTGGLFQSGSSTVTFGGATDGLQIPADLSFYNLTVNKTSGHSIGVAGSVSTTGAFLISGGQFNFGPYLFNAYGNVSYSGSGTTDVDNQTNATGTLAFVGSENQTMGGITAYHVSVNKPSGTLTCTTFCAAYGALRVANGIFDVGSAYVNLNATGTAFVINSTGTFAPSTGTMVYRGNATTTIAPTVYYNLSLSPGSASTTYSLSASTTAVGTLTVGSSATFAIGTNTFTTLGTISNSNLITENTSGGGSIVHAAESAKVTNSSGTEVSSIATNGTIYVTVQDSNRNLNAQSAETMTVSLSGDSSSGSDSETLTLTETTPSSGIFRNTTGLNLVNSGKASTGNGQFEIKSTGTGTTSYTDNQDSADGATDTFTLSYTSASSQASTGGGGIGGGGSIPISTTYQVSVQSNQGNLTNLTNVGVAVHNLIKLPNDGNASTQYDSAVYYVGSDGKRHAFPNDKVYFTWYSNFDGVQIVNQTQLASIPLGANVTYKPGFKMVKFTTDPKVYVVAKGGALRWVKTEAAAIELYGSNWNTTIDDIGDAFYANYTFGNDVTGLSDFNPTTVQASVSYPSDSLAM